MKQLRFLLKLSVMSVATLAVTTFTGVDCVYASAGESNKSAGNINISNIDLTTGFGKIVSNAFEENIKAVAEGVDKDDKNGSKVEYWAKTEKFSSSIENLKKLFTFVWNDRNRLVDEYIYKQAEKRLSNSIKEALASLSVGNSAGKNVKNEDDKGIKKVLGLINGLIALKTLYKVGNKYKGTAVDKGSCEMIFDEVWTESSNDTWYCDKLLKYFGGNKNRELKEIVEHDWKCYLTQFFVICNGEDKDGSIVSAVVTKVAQKIAESGNKDIIIKNIENAKTSTNVSSLVMKQQTKIESYEKEKEKKLKKNEIYIIEENSKDTKGNIKSEKNLNEDIKNSAKSGDKTKTEIYSTLKSILKSVETDGDPEKDNLMKCYMDEIVKYIGRVNNKYYFRSDDTTILSKLQELSSAEEWPKERFNNAVNACLTRKMPVDDFAILINVAESVQYGKGVISSAMGENGEINFASSIGYTFNAIDRILNCNRSDDAIVSDSTDGCIVSLQMYIKSANVSFDQKNLWSEVVGMSKDFENYNINEKFGKLGNPLLSLLNVLPKKVEDPLNSDLFSKISDLYFTMEGCVQNRFDDDKNRDSKKFTDYGEKQKIETYSAELNRIVQLIRVINTLEKPSKTSTALLDLVIKLWKQSSGFYDDAVKNLKEFFDKCKKEIKYVTDLNKYIDV